MTRKQSLGKPVEAYHHGDLRRTLIDATLSKVESSGSQTVSLAALARELGVSQSAPYRHFQDREQLLAAAAAEGFRIFIAVLRKSIDGISGRQAVARMAKAYVTFGTDRPGLYQLMFASQILSAASDWDEVKIVARESFAVLVAALAPSPNRARRAMRIWTSLHGAVMLNCVSLLKSDISDVSLDELLDDIVA